MIDNWKSFYSNSNGSKVTDPVFYSEYGSLTNSDGSRMNPFNGMNINSEVNTILGNGVFHLNHASEVNIIDRCIVGTNKRTSFLNINDPCITRQSLKDLTLEANNVDLHIGKYNTNTQTSNWVNCIVKRNIKSYSSNLVLRNCLILSKITESPQFQPYNTTFINSSFSTYVNGGILTSGNNGFNVIHNSKVSITKTSNIRYTAFSNCSFLIGNETEHTPLIGNNSAELLTDYITRCKAQSISILGIESLYVFSNNSLDDLYRVKDGSEIDEFGLKSGVYFGYEQPIKGNIPIQADLKENSFNDIQGISKGMSVENGIIMLNNDANVMIGATKQSSLLVFDKVKAVSELSITYNLPPSTFASTAKQLYKVSVNDKIKPNTNYVVSTNDDSLATLEYNEIKYSSDPSGNNIFRGVEGVSKIITDSKNLVLSIVTDYVGIPSIGIRAIIQPQRKNIASGDLRKGYWYVVDQGSIEYKGNTYSKYGSFLADSETMFTDLGDGIVHEVFIDNEEQNPFVSVFVSKPTAAMTNFSTAAKDPNGIAVGSSNPYYSEFIGKGYMESSLQGRIIQLKVGITTKNG